MSSTRTATTQCRLYTRLTSLQSQSQSQRQFHQSVITFRRDMQKTYAQRREAEERRRTKAEEEKKKKEQPRAPPQQRTAQRDSQATDGKSFRVGNPDAKLVPVDELDVRHLLYAERHVGEVLAFPDDIARRLDALGMFTEKYGFQYMRRPVSMIRQNSGLVARQLLAEDVRQLGTKDRRVIVSGKGGSGKSFILLQIAAMALMQDYLVLAVPRGMDLVDNRTAYQLDESTMRYRQTRYLADMLGRTRKACAQALENQFTNERLRLGKEVFAQGTPLVDLLEWAEVHPASSQEALQLFLLEMARSDRPPILFLFDNISAISVPSRIPSPEYPHRPVHPHRLWIPFFYTCLLNGTLNHPKAAVIAATSQFPSARTLEIALGEVEQDPYEPIDRRIPHSIAGATVIRAGDQLTPAEAMGLSSYYREAGLLKVVDRFNGLNKSVGDPDYLNPKSTFWTLSGNKEQSTDKQPASDVDPYGFKRRGRMNPGIVQKYVKRGGPTGKEDPKDIEATMERLAMAGGTARGFWKVCTRMSHF